MKHPAGAAADILSVCVVDTDSKSKLLSPINKSKNENISRVMLDLDIAQQNAMELLVETRRRLHNTPIIVMSSDTRMKALGMSRTQPVLEYRYIYFAYAIFCLRTTSIFCSEY